MITHDILHAINQSESWRITGAEEATWSAERLMGENK